MYQKPKLVKFLIVIYLLTILGCDFTQTEQPDEPKIIRIDGSTTLYKAFLAVSDRFMKLSPGVNVVNSESSTGEGIEKLIGGEIEIARAARSLREEEVSLAEVQGKNLIQTQIGFDGVCLIIHPEKFKTIKQITKQQVKEIFFDGVITDWSQLNAGLKGPIRVYVRDSFQSGTADLFDHVLVNSSHIPYIQQAQKIQSTTELVPLIAGDVNGITYSPIGFLNDSVRALAFGEDTNSAVSCTPKNIRDRSYLLQRDLFIITNSIPEGLIAQFVSFILSKEGQDLLNNNGIISM